MNSQRPSNLRVPIANGDSVSALVDMPNSAVAVLVLAHGAGAGMKHPSMKALVQALNDVGVATFRYQFPYMEKGSKRPDSPTTTVQTVRAAIASAAREFPKLPIFAGGKSFGGRMTTTAASMGELDPVRGIVCFSFPLHPSKEPAVQRAEHMKQVSLPTLWIQGTRDDLAELKLVKKVAKKYGSIDLHIVDGADHGYGVLKSSGRKPDEVIGEVAQATLEFCARHI